MNAFVSGRELKAPGNLSASGRARVGRLTGVRVIGVGSYLPERIVPNDELASLGCDAEWIVQRTGIRERRRAAPEQASSDLAYLAARRAIEAAEIAPGEIDSIVVASMTPDTPTPGNASRLQHRLGALAPAIDLNVACSGFGYALVTGAMHVATGFAKRVLVVGAETMSRTIDPNDRKTFPLFGDGAGAIVLAPGDGSQGLLSFALGTEGDGIDALNVPGGGYRNPITAEDLAAGKQFMRMDGRAVFKWATRVAADAVRDMLAHAGLTLDDLRGVILHQANARILEAVAGDLGAPSELLWSNVAFVGNTSSASIPLVLDEAMREGRISRGDKILMCGFGAGLAWGGGIFAW